MIELPGLVPRHAKSLVTEALADTRVVLVNGARQAGKSTLTRLAASRRPGAVIRMLDDPATLQAAKDDPMGFVDREGLMVIDEIQLVPELLRPIKLVVDLDPTPGGVGLGASLGGASTGQVVDTAAEKNIRAKKAEGKKAARKGDAEEVWRRMGMRTLKKAVKQDLKCVANSFGQVREFFVRTPCKSLDRVLFGIGDDQGNFVVVSVAWVGFHTRGDAREFKWLDDLHGTGNITPLAGALLGLADISFTGHHYQSRRDGKTTVIAETEPATGQVSDEVLDAVADVAVLLPRP